MNAEYFHDSKLHLEFSHKGGGIRTVRIPFTHFPKPTPNWLSPA